MYLTKEFFQDISVLPGDPDITGDIENYITISKSNDDSLWTLQISEDIKTDNWYDLNYPDPYIGSIPITIEYFCNAGKDSELVMNASFIC